MLTTLANLVDPDVQITSKPLTVQVSTCPESLICDVYLKQLYLRDLKTGVNVIEGNCHLKDSNDSLDYPPDLHVLYKSEILFSVVTINVPSPRITLLPDAIWKAVDVSYKQHETFSNEFSNC